MKSRNCFTFPGHSNSTSIFLSLSSKKTRSNLIMSSERFLLALIFLVSNNLLAFVTAELPSIRCVDNGINHTSNSVYDANLNTLLSSLPTNVNSSGFYHASVGQNPERANAIVLCRGDIQLEACRSCVQEATTELVKSCLNHKQGVIWYIRCMLRYSNESIFGIQAGNSIMVAVFNTMNVSSPSQFNMDLRTLLDDLRGKAAYGSALRKVAAANKSTSAFQTIFGLVQCTPDLSPDDCSSCLIRTATYLPQCCESKRAARVFTASCDLRYDIDPFYNETRLQEFLTLVPVAPPPLPPPPPPPPPGKKDDSKAPLVVIITVASIAASLFLFICVGLILLRIKRKQKPKEKLESVDDSSTADSLQFDFDKVRAATNDFSDANKLGEGGFGIVYRGRLANGQEIAVKRLSMRSDQGDLEFKNEVLLVARLQHRNLARLLGFTLQRNERLLVYEFIQNASLDKFIFDPVKRLQLDWERRYKIIEGIAKGLLYLHEDSRFRIIHRDLKASNVLLDRDMNPKIADFGMARLFVVDGTRDKTSKIAGTYGYMAPEYAMHGYFSVKSDVFSFGVLILEILSGKTNYSFRDENGEDLLSCAWKKWRKGKAADIIDPMLRNELGTMRNMLRIIHIGLLCVQERSDSRPTTASVVLMLGSLSVTLPVPSQPAYFLPGGPDSRVSPLSDNNSREIKSRNSPKRCTQSSKNDVSISELYPR